MDHSKSIAISQSNYIPWKGYFDLINSVDEFVIYDDAQFTKRDWRNRNKIVTNRGLTWLTIPLKVKGNYQQKVFDMHADGVEWRAKHWETIRHNYSKARYFHDYKAIFESLYLGSRETKLSLINYAFIAEINKILGVTTPILWSSEFCLRGDASEKLATICIERNAGSYLSGPAAKSYLRSELFIENNIEVCWIDYAHYPVYPQFCNRFDHHVSILDLIFNVGPEAPMHLIGRKTMPVNTSRSFS